MAKEIKRFTDKFHFISSQAIESAVHRWAEWQYSLDRARKQLDWKEDFSNEDVVIWAQKLDQEKVWKLALESLDKLRLPRLWAAYWIACLTSSYHQDDSASYWKIHCPSWVCARMIKLIDECLFEDDLSVSYGKRSGAVIVNDGRCDNFRGEERGLPPLGIEITNRDPPSHVVIVIPTYLLPGLIRDPSPLSELLRRDIVSQYGKHPLSQLLQSIGPSKASRSADWARTEISKAELYQLPTLHKCLVQQEYSYEVIESLSPRELRQATKSAGNMAHDPLVLGDYADKLLPNSKQVKVKERVRKRVDGWFKQTGRWPLPKGEE